MSGVGAEGCFADADIDRLFNPWANRRGVLIAVSGGPDSMALAQMAARWARNAGRPPLYVATVDHGLRPDSQAEAHAVGGWLAAIGLPHTILAWEGEKPRTRIQERAREARYALLFDHAARVGADTVMTAHHADDQAETILFRLTRGSGVAGIAGMAREQRVGGVWLARPLLDQPKAALVAFCNQVGQPYVRDPSNDNPAYARVCLRRLAATLAAQGLDSDALLRLGRRAARAEVALSAQAAVACVALASRIEGETRLSDWRSLRVAPAEVVLRALRAELTATTGAIPRLDRLEQLTDRVRAALERREALAATLAGARIALSANGEMRMTPERRRRRSGSAGGTDEILPPRSR